MLRVHQTDVALWPIQHVGYPQNNFHSVETKINCTEVVFLQISPPQLSHNIVFNIWQRSQVSFFLFQCYINSTLLSALQLIILNLSKYRFCCFILSSSLLGGCGVRNDLIPSASHYPRTYFRDLLQFRNSMTMVCFCTKFQICQSSIRRIVISTGQSCDC